MSTARRATYKSADTPNMDEVICPNCAHQFRAIPQNVQAENASLREELTTRERLYKEQWQRAEQTEARALANEKDKKQLLTRLVDALESAVDWAGYASEYFREKHQHQLDIDKLDAARDELAAIDAAIGAKHD